jgi:two-component system sensor histidine kinase DegS
LAYRGLIVGALRMECRPGAALEPDEADFFQNLAPEIARALVFSISYPQQIEQAQTTAQLGERREIAQFLHNSLAQQIGFLHLNLDRLAGGNGLLQPEAVRAELEQMREVAGDAYIHVRNILAILRSEEPSELIPTIENYLRTTAQRLGQQIDFTAQGAPRGLPPRATQSIFSLLQEGLTNVYKHAQAQSVQVALCWSDRDLTLCIKDDGIGFDPTAPIQAGHYGITMMRERVRSLGGELRIQSAPGAGTELEFRIPV